MLNLEKHIAELLVQYDCVIVPNLGGFVANMVSADFNEKTGVFNPPKREIGFNRSLCHNDGLLVSYVASKEGLSYSTCQHELAKHIDILKNQLFRGESIGLKEIGVLKINSIGNIVFVPDETDAFSTSSFGLSTFHFNSLLQDKEQNEISRRFIKRTVTVNKSIRSVAASAALIFGLLMISPNLHYDTQQSNFSELFSDVGVSGMDSDITGISEEALPVEKNESEPVDNKDNVGRQDIVGNAVEIVSSKRYYVIAGSFKDLAPANKFLDKVKRNGILNAELLDFSKGRYRVSLESYNVKEDAVAALNEYRAEKGYKTAWILSQSK